MPANAFQNMLAMLNGDSGQPTQPTAFSNMMGMFDKLGSSPAVAPDTLTSDDPNFKPLPPVTTEPLTTPQAKISKDGKLVYANDPVTETLPLHQKALLNAIAAPESGGAYNVRYTPQGGAAFEGGGEHPNIPEPGPAGPSTAAGRYQFTGTTWRATGGGQFTPEAQDSRAISLAQSDFKRRTGRDLDTELQTKGLTPDVLKALAPTWLGLKDKPSKAIDAYNRTLKRGTPKVETISMEDVYNDQPVDGINPNNDGGPASKYNYLKQQEQGMEIQNEGPAGMQEDYWADNKDRQRRGIPPREEYIAQKYGDIIAKKQQNKPCASDPNCTDTIGQMRLQATGGGNATGR